MEIKAVLVNTGETDIDTDPFTGLAPITRIGGGEVRVDRALESPAAVWDTFTRTPTLSFSFRDITRERTTISKIVTVHNYSNRPVLYSVEAGFRYADDAATDAVKLRVPSYVYVRPRSNGYFIVRMEIDGAKLRDWGMNSGSSGANPDLLTLFEYDGYITLDNRYTHADDADPLHIPWQTLLRKAGDVRASSHSIEFDYGDYPGVGTVDLKNKGVGDVSVETYSLIAESPNLPEGTWGGNAPIIDLRYVGYATYFAPADTYCGSTDSYVMAFAINTWERQTMAIAPASFFIDIDVDQDGVYDYEVFNWDLSLPGISDGRNVTWVADLSAGTASVWFFTDHTTNSANTVLTFCGDQIGQDITNIFQPMDIFVGVQDIYFTGNVTDYVDGITISPFGEQYYAPSGGAFIASGDTETLVVEDYGPFTNNTETGLLLRYLHGPFYNEAAAIKAAP